LIVHFCIHKAAGVQLLALDEHLKARYRLEAKGYDFSYAQCQEAQIREFDVEQILNLGKPPSRLYARRQFC
jgi:hypothetical protein